MGGFSQRTPSKRTVSGTGADDEYLTKLRQHLINSFSEDELRALCAKLQMDYSRLPGYSKASIVDALIATLRRRGRIHELVKQCAELQRGVRSEAKTNTPSSPQIGSSTTLPGKEGREKRQVKTLEQRKDFLRQFFDGRPIALEEDLCKSWECTATQIIHRFRPAYVKHRITALSEDIAGIDFIKNLESQASGPSTSALSAASTVQGEWNLGQEASRLDPAFLNYHSVCCWYRQIRFGIKCLLALFATIGVLLLLVIAASTMGGVLVLSGMKDISYVPDESEPGLVYTVPEAGTYHVEVRDTAAPEDHSYRLRVTRPSSDIVTPDFSQHNVWPLGPGDQVFAQVRYAQQHLYYIDSNVGETIFVTLHRWYADADLNFVLLDSEMNECSTVSLLKVNSLSRHAYLTHTVTSGSPHFLRVQIAQDPLGPSLSLSSRYGFQVHMMQDYTETEPNDDLESSAGISPGMLVRGSLNSSDRDYYHFSAQAGQRFEISAANLSDSPLSTVTLYRLTASGPELVAHSTRSVPITPEVGRRLFETSRGRAYAISILLNAFGLNTSPADFMGNSWELWAMYLPAFLFAVLCGSYTFFVTYLAERKYGESLAIRHIANVLLELQDDDALRSESKKANIRLSTNLASQTVRKIHRISSFPALQAPPREMEAHMAKVAALIMQTNTVVSTPDGEALPSLRRRFVEWLGVFLRSEYGQFHFAEDFDTGSMRWHQQIRYAVQQHWKRVVAVVMLALLATILTQPVWRRYQAEIVPSVWLILRYIILVVAVYAVYTHWGAPGIDEKPESKWQNVVRLILFFFVPFFAFDALLQTRIIESIIRLVSNLEIF